MKKTLATLTVAVATFALAGCSTDSGPSIEPIEFPSSSGATMIEPGDHIAKGDAAWVPYDPQNPGNFNGVALIDVVAGDETYWDDFANGDEYTEFTPYFVVYQTQAIRDALVSYGPELLPVLSDGTEARIVEAEGGISGFNTSCAIDVPYLEDIDKTLWCIVAIDPENTQKVVGISFHNSAADGYSEPNPETNPWVENPAIWSVDY
jgi:predicted small lipoprotein YifL